MASKKIDFKDIKLIVLLGNPGREYEKTRHNIAWRLKKGIEKETPLSLKEKFKGRWTPLNLGSTSLKLLLPQTFMNKSGESIQEACTFFKIKPEEVLIVHDELELPFGTIQLKKGGGLGGHNGLRSTKQNLKTDDFFRLKMGIGRPERQGVASYVLSAFSREEEPLMELYGDRTFKIIKSIFLPSGCLLKENQKYDILRGMPS